MGTIRKFEDLEAWSSARVLSRTVYSVTRNGTFRDDADLKRQLRRASVSVMSNIAEGFERGGRKEFLHFLKMAKGSVGEIESQLYVAFDQGYVTEADCISLRSLAIACKRKIAGLMHYLHKHGRDQNDFSVREENASYGLVISTKYRGKAQRSAIKTKATRSTKTRKQGNKPTR
ncbi:MAG: four helix bundle protein [Planctomycetota bacterium]|nr:four helix bundle protein [Planctomycetota bacterium]